MIDGLSCGNSCVFGSPAGMGTNGPCHCLDRHERTVTHGKIRYLVIAIGILEKDLEACHGELARVRAEVPCPECLGAKKVREHGSWNASPICPACNGSGRKYEENTNG